MAAYLIDTNHASAFMSNVQPVTERISHWQETVSSSISA